MSIRSMTGYARVTRSAGDREFVVSLKSLNHRALDIHFHLPAELEPFEPALRSAVKRSLVRGHLDLRITMGRPSSGGTIRLNRPLLESYLAAHRQAASEYGIDSEPDLNSALRIPGMFEPVANGEFGPELEGSLLEALETALAELNKFRTREGVEIKGKLQARNRAILAAVEKLRKLREAAVPAFEERLRRRLEGLLNGSVVDPQRLAQEVALLVDRSDIGEELERLEIHAGELEALLEAGGEVGKKLDFLLQEMNRETNTILSKTGSSGEAGLEITSVALSVRSDVEKIREQSLNLE
jgi:uncharacterized protein (TIGR00255 family)